MTTDESDDGGAEQERQKLDVEFAKLEDEELGLDAPVNIIVCGLTGVGKSTLINAMFGEDFCRTGTGAPVTRGIRPISQPGKPVVIYDTEGLEIEDSARTVASLKALIATLRREPDARRQPHAMWLCVNTEAARFEEVHGSLVALAVAERLPVMVVLTQDYYGDSEELAGAISQQIDDAIPVVPIVAQSFAVNGRVIPTRGLDLLLRTTLSRIPSAARAALEFAQVADLNLRLTKAKSIVNRSAAIAAGSAFPASFVWGAHSAFLLALETHMLRSINKTVGLPMGNKESKALTVGLTGVAMAAAGGPLVAAQLAALIPGLGQITAATAGAATAATLVKLLGSTYVHVVTQLVQRGELDPTVEQIVEMVRSCFGELGSGRPLPSHLGFPKGDR